MLKTSPPYSPEFRGQIVDPARAGRDPADLAREFDSTAQANWQEGRWEEKGNNLNWRQRVAGRRRTALGSEGAGA
jgi:transposase